VSLNNLLDRIAVPGPLGRVISAQSCGGKHSAPPVRNNKMETNESIFLTTLQEFVAVTAVGVSALRNQGKGTLKYVRNMISKLNLSEIKNLSEENYGKWLNKKTDLILKTWPHSKKPWGAVRKALNLFMRDALYNQYLNNKYKISKIENSMEIPLDSFISKELIKRNHTHPIVGSDFS
jgi:hypothetical protein